MKKNFKVNIVTETKLVGGIIEQVVEEKTVTSGYTKRYDIGLDKLIQLSYCEIYLLLWLAEKVDVDCSVEVGARARMQFINFIVKISQSEKEIIYKDNTVIAAIQTLKKLGFLLQPPVPAKRGWCWLNPLYFFREQEDRRVGAIKDVFNSLAGNRDSKLYSKHNFDREMINIEAAL